jgi:cytochrome c553
MRCFVLTTAFWAVVGLVIAVLVVSLGLYNVSARQGHLPGVSWVLHTTYRNAVELRAPPASAVPELTDDLAALGARHYDSACRFCHASPGELQYETVRDMVPHPPHVEKAIEHWDPQHLFWIVKNGVKMTGMPAWPSKRDDDVWAVVAFLDRVKGMDADAYRSLAALPDEGPFKSTVAYCESCHARPGEVVANSHIPRLDIQTETYLSASLQAYRDGKRFSGVMQHAASELGDEDIAKLARHFASEAPAPDATASGQADATSGSASVEQGRKLATSEDLASDVPACAACHGPWPTRRSEKFPSLAGQGAAYLLTQLRLWKDGKRGGTDVAHLMHKVVPDLKEAQMRALADYYASLPPQKNGPMTRPSQ